KDGASVVEYKYDAWGNHKVSGRKASTIGNLNPFRYRSYFYDTETGLYFLQTRYYDPQVGRFLNMDSVQYADPEATNGLNLYVYCANNPVMYADPTGTSFILLAAILLGAAFGAMEGYISAKTNDRDIGWGIALGALGGAFMGLVTGGTSLLLGAEALAGQLMIVGIASLVTGMSTEALNQVVNNEPTDAGNIIASGISSMLTYSLSYGFSFGVSKVVPLDTMGMTALTLGTTMLFEPIMILLGLPSRYYNKARKK
ncbi:MAG: RHS repeat-associated core domain-containing protein, partial [Clostridia bacterium]|nr:RHS repeat-associated core domain-containing protein [Clostridia bacterium]